MAAGTAGDRRPRMAACARLVTVAGMLTILDAVGTAVAVRQLGAIELNPLLRTLIAMVGVEVAMLVRAVLGLALLAFIGMVAARRPTPLATPLLLLAAAVLFTVNLWNGLQIGLRVAGHL